ncbi:MAG: hypothetical protein WBL68_01010 [Nitrososphaeraceae archaeon]
MNKKATIVGILSTLFTLSTILLNTPYLNIAYAQVSGTPGEAGVKNASEPYFAPLNMTGPETATEFGQAGLDEPVLANDTDISNPNITALDSTSVNEREDCISIPGNTAEDCP